jgi:tungstate transport system ATP-binding protein
MHGIERISGGQVAWQADDRARHAFVFQQPIMLRRSVLDNLAYPLQLAGRSRAAARDVAAEWAGRIGLSDLADFPAPRLSGGERQKLALARALIGKPEVLFLDEPCASLDGHATREIEDLLLATARAGAQIIMATHNMGQARRLADRVVFLLNGTIHETGAARLLDQPASPQMQAFLRGDIVT